MHCGSGEPSFRENDDQKLLLKINTHPQRNDILASTIDSDINIGIVVAFQHIYDLTLFKTLLLFTGFLLSAAALVFCKAHC